MLALVLMRSFYLQSQSLPVWPPVWPQVTKRLADWNPGRLSLAQAEQSLVKIKRSSEMRSWGRRSRKKSFLLKHHQGLLAAEAAETSWHEMDHWLLHQDHHWHHLLRPLRLPLEEGREEKFIIWINNFLKYTQRGPYNSVNTNLLPFSTFTCTAWLWLSRVIIIKWTELWEVLSKKQQNPRTCLNSTTLFMSAHYLLVQQKEIEWQRQGPWDAQAHSELQCLPPRPQSDHSRLQGPEPGNLGIRWL